MAAWSRAHGDALPRHPAAAAVVRGLITAVDAAAVPLARASVSPSAVTAAGCAVSLAAVPVAARGGRWAVPAGVLLVAGGLLDNLDGAVARLSGRESRRGAVLDAVTDRLSDAAGPAVLRLLGAPAGSVLAAIGASSLHEYARARAQGEGMSGPGVITVSERPTRVAVAALVALDCGLRPALAPARAGAGAGLAAALGLAGLAQVLLALRRELREPQEP